ESPYLGNINVRWGVFNLENLKSMRVEETEFDRYSLKVGDLVICEGGEPGRCAVWENNDATVFIQKALHRVRFTDSYNSKFAFYYLVYATPLERVIKNFTGTTIKHLTGAGLNKIHFPICTFQEQGKIVNDLELQFSEIEALEKELNSQLKKSDSLRQSVVAPAKTDSPNLPL
ncbi:restriction endonuclease subunit S, partial [Methylophaga pinxianii]